MSLAEVHTLESEMKHKPAHRKAGTKGSHTFEQRLADTHKACARLAHKETGIASAILACPDTTK